MVVRGLCIVIEDDEDIRELITLILTRMRFDVHAFEYGRDGVTAALEDSPVLVTMDLNLPDIDGLEAARHIRSKSDVPMVFITARAEADDELTGLASGATAYLTKPFHPRYLVETVERLCAASSLTSNRRDSQA